MMITRFTDQPVYNSILNIQIRENIFFKPFHQSLL